MRVLYQMVYAFSLYHRYIFFIHVLTRKRISQVLRKSFFIRPKWSLRRFFFCQRYNLRPLYTFSNRENSRFLSRNLSDLLFRNLRRQITDWYALLCESNMSVFSSWSRSGKLKVLLCGRIDWRTSNFTSIAVGFWNYACVFESDWLSAFIFKIWKLFYFDWRSAWRRYDFFIWALLLIVL